MLRASLLFLAVYTAHADTLREADLATAAQLRDGAIAGSGAFDIVESLVTEVGHRMAGTPNDAKGRAWAQAKFTALGYDKVYTQKVSFPVWERGFENAAILSPDPAPLTITALGGSIGTPQGGIRGEIVSFKDAADLEKAAPGSLSGKIAYVAKRMQRAKDGSDYGVVVIARSQGAIYAARAGAVGVLIRSVGTDENTRTPHTGNMRYDNMLTRIPAAALASADADALERALSKGAPVTVKFELGSRVRKGDYESANVIGEITGSDHPDEIVAIGGHLDSWDLGEGAIDNGAGVAITMAAGALIGRLETAPKRTIRVIAFANEEQGVFGGKEYARLAGADGSADQHVVAAESDFGAGRIYRFTTRFKAGEIAAAEQIFSVLQPLGIERGDNAASGGADFSALRDLGVPLLGLSQDGTHYFDYHHTAADTLDKIKPADLDFNVAAYAATAYLAAQAGMVFGPVPVASPAPVSPAPEKK